MSTTPSRERPTTVPAGSSWLTRDQGAAAMELDPTEVHKVVNRLKRAQGQLAGVIRMLEEGRDCEDVVTQLSAVTKALDRSGFAIIASSMRQCLLEADGDDDAAVRTLQKLFLSLA